MKDALSALMVFALEAVCICLDAGVEVVDERDAEELTTKGRIVVEFELQDKRQRR